MEHNPARDAWNERYSVEHYVYGTAPNDFLRERAAAVPPGRALCLADGEGRNSVHLARLGFEVTSVDISEVAMAKTRALAAKHRVRVDTHVADLADWDLGVGRWDLIASVFAHMPAPLRRSVHARAVDALAPNGVFVLEAYTPAQLGRGTGGPPVIELMMELEVLLDELRPLRVEHGEELVREMSEGQGHDGEGAVVQLVARRPVADA